MTAPAPTRGDKQELSPLVNMSRYRLQVPLTETADYMGGSSKPKCMICGKSFCVGRSLDWKGSGHYPRKWYGLCTRHYISAFFAGATLNRIMAEAAILSKVPLLYRFAEFNTFKARGDRAAHLSVVREAVVDWAQAMVEGWDKVVPGTNAGSLYLYAGRTRNYTGNGCGKTHLAYSAFKYIARRTMAENSHACDPTDETPVLTCAIVDIQDIVSGFFKLKAAAEGEHVWCNFEVWSSKGTRGSFDDYVANLAAAPVLLIDDIGHGSYTGRNGEPNLAATTAETIIDQRANNRLPTFYTSNYAPDDPGKKIGTRAASRIFRGNCTKVIRVEAPDYAM